MPTINQLSAASTLSADDLVAIFATANGDARKASLSLLAEFIASLIQEDLVIDQPFNPSFGSGITVAPGVATASSAIGAGSKNIVLSNTGAVAVYVRTGASTVVATTADYLVMPLTQVSITKDQDHTHLAYIAPAGGGALHAIAGEGE